MLRSTIISSAIGMLLANATFALEPELWAEDILQYEEGLKEFHIDPFSVISEAEFNSAVEKLRSSLPEKTDADVVLELKALTRRIGDGHTAIRTDSSKRFPLELYFIDGNWKVVGVHADHADMLGSSLISINGRPVAEVAATLKPFLQHVDNSQSEELRLSEALVDAELLSAMKLIGDSGATSFVYSGESGEADVLLEIPESPDSSNFTRFDTSQPVITKVSGTETVWFGLLADTNAIYVKFASYPAFEQMEAFGEELLTYINSNQSSRLVVDFRGNGGGDFFVGLTLAYYLNLADSIDWQSGVFLLTDKYTFSAAVSNAAQFRQILNATIVGEPTGGNPVGYQDMGSFKLKNSDLTVTYSKRLFRFQDQATNGIQPDLPVAYDWNAYTIGVDNILQFVVEKIHEAELTPN
jgi:hypothetical protein